MPPPKLSVVVTDSTTGDREACLFSLACQQEKIEVLTLDGGTVSDALRRATAPFASIVGSNCIVYPEHFTRLLAAIQTAPVALARGVLAAVRKTPTGLYLEAKRPEPLDGQPDPAAPLRHRWLLAGLVTPTARLLEAATSAGGDPRLALLTSASAPALLGGPPSFEVRVDRGGTEWRALWEQDRPRGWRRLSAELRIRRPELHGALRAFIRRAARGASD